MSNKSTVSKQKTTAARRIAGQSSKLDRALPRLSGTRSEAIVKAIHSAKKGLKPGEQLEVYSDGTIQPKGGGRILATIPKNKK